MSAGNFIRSFYETDAGEIARIKLQPETIAGFNIPVSGPATLPISARATGGNNRIGIKARAVTLRWSGAPPTGYSNNDTVRVPVMSPSVFNGLNLGDTVVYLGTNAEVVGKNPERVR